MFAKEICFMKENCWSKTLLGVYNYLETIAGAMDKIILKSALNSFNFSKLNYEKNNVLNISNRLIDLSERKITLINLKLVIEEGLKNIPQKDALLLVAKYINRMKIQEISEKYSISTRSIFRKLTDAEAKFLYALSTKGFTSHKLKEMLKNEHWIMNYYNELTMKNNSDFSLSMRAIERVAGM